MTVQVEMNAVQKEHTQTIGVFVRVLLWYPYYDYKRTPNKLNFNDWENDQKEKKSYG